MTLVEFVLLAIGIIAGTCWWWGHATRGGKKDID